MYFETCSLFYKLGRGPYILVLVRKIYLRQNEEDISMFRKITLLEFMTHYWCVVVFGCWDISWGDMGSRGWRRDTGSRGRPGWRGYTESQGGDGTRGREPRSRGRLGQRRDTGSRGRRRDTGRAGSLRARTAVGCGKQAAAGTAVGCSMAAKKAWRDSIMSQGSLSWWTTSAHYEARA